MCGFPCSSVGKESANQNRKCKRHGSILGSGRSLGEGNGNTLQYSCLENPMDRGAWWATVHGVATVGHNWATEPPPPSGKSSPQCWAHFTGFPSPKSWPWDFCLSCYLFKTFSLGGGGVFNFLIFATVLEFSSLCLSFSHAQLFGTPWTVACQTPLSMGFSRQGYWSGLPFPSPKIFPTQGSNPGLLHCRQILYQLSYKGSHTSKSQ